MNQYPSLHSLFGKINLPDNIGFLEVPENLLNAALEEILGNFLYRYLQVHTSASGDSAFYGFELLTNKALALEIPGTQGLALMFNPTEGLDYTAIPLTFSYQWPVLRYLDEFDNLLFGGTLQEYLDLILRVTGISQRSLLEQAIFSFSGETDDSIRDFIILFNDALPQDNEYDLNRLNIDETDLDVISEHISDRGLEEVLQSLIFGTYVGLGQGTFEQQLDRLKILFEPQLGFFTEESLKRILIPRFSLTIDELSLALKFPTSILKPKDPALPASLLKFTIGSVRYTTEDGLEFGAVNGLTFTPSYVLGTGFWLGFEGAKLDLSRTTNIPEAIADGRPADFIGVYAEELTIGFPDVFKNKDGDAVTLKGKRLLIGTGGISGRIGLESGEALDLRLGKADGFSVALTEFFLEFQQNSVKGGGAKGELTIPFGGRNNLKKIGIDLMFQENGNFSIVGKNVDIEFDLAKLLFFKVRDLGVGQQGGRFFVSVGGEMSLGTGAEKLNFIEEGIKFDIRKLIIWEDGSLEFESGGITLPVSIKLKLGPVDFSVTKLHFGTYRRDVDGRERKYYYIGFDGGLKAGDAGVDIQGKGIRYYFSYDQFDDNSLKFDSFFRMDGIGIDLSIPKKDPKLLLKGFLLIKEQYYAGSVQFALPSVGLKGGATMVLDPDYPSFLIDAYLDLPAPIPLGPTGLGIYGFRGLFGNNYVLDKKDESWWEFYKRPIAGLPPITELAQINNEGGAGKFKRSRGGLVIGAGVTIATVGDNGWAFSSKVMLVLALPQALIIAGQATMLAERSDLDGPNDPPFGIMLAFSPESIEAGLWVNYKLPSSSGDVLDLKGSMELAYFFKNSSAWYLNIGRDTPETARITARLLTLFEVYAFLMISAKGIRGGSGFEWGMRKEFGPVRVELGVWMHVRGFISFRPIQLGGSIDLGGMVKVGLFCFNISIYVRAYLAAEAPCPLQIQGSLEIRIGTPWPLKNINVNVGLNWRIRDCVHNEPLSIMTSGAESPPPAVAVHIPSGRTFPIQNFGSTKPSIHAFDPKNLIPMDCFIDLVFSQSLLPEGVNNIGGHFDAVEHRVSVPPERGVSGQTEHVLKIQAVNISYWDNGEWQPYRVYEQMEKLMDAIEVKEGIEFRPEGEQPALDVTQMKDGYWQLTEPNRLNKVRLLSQNVFSYTTNAVSGSLTLEGMGFSETSLLCRHKIKEKTCIDWTDQQAGTVYPLQELFDYKGVTFKIDGGTAKVSESALVTDQLVRWEILFDDPVLTLHELTLVSDAVVKASFYRLAERTNTQTNMPELYYVLISERYYNETGRGGAEISIGYDAGETGFSLDRLVITTYALAQPPRNTGDLLLGSRLGSRRLDFFEGELDDFKVFNRSLAREEVVQAMQSSRYPQEGGYGTEGTNPSGLTGWWDLGGYQGADQSGNGHHGFLSDRSSFGMRTLEPSGRGTETWKSGFSTSFVVPHREGLSFDDSSYTLMAWVKPSVPQDLQNKQYTIFSKEFGQEGYFFGLEIIGPPPPIQLGAQRYSFRLVWQDFRRRVANGPLSGFTWRSRMETVYSGDLNHRENIRLKPIPLIRDPNGNWVIGEIPVQDGPLVLDAVRIPWYHVAVSVDRTTGIARFFLQGREMESVQDDRLTLRHGDTSFKVAGAYTVRAKKLCFTTRKVKEILATIPESNEIKTETQAMSEAMTRYLQPIWRPGTRFLVEIKGTDEFGGRRDEQSYYFGFETHGPVGHEPPPQDGAEGPAPLLPYVDFDKSYPNADGYLAHAKPLYYNQADIRLFFNRPYMYTMYGNWGGYQSRLELKIFGAIGNKTDEMIELTGGWELNDFNQWEDDAGFLEQINKYVKGHPCDDSDCDCQVLSGGLHRFSLNARYELPALEPNKLYTAVFYAHYQSPGEEQRTKEVLRYVFRTSRYADLKAQIGSYVLNEKIEPTLKALFPLDLGSITPDDLKKAYQLADGAVLDMDPELEQAYADPFDRLMNGMLKFPTLAPPAVTEVNVVSAGVDGVSVRLGLLVRSPEPFFDPRIPLERLMELGSLVFTEGGQPANVRMLFSKDRSQIWITGSLGSTPEIKQFRLSFSSVVFDGKDYLKSKDEPQSLDITLS